MNKPALIVVISLLVLGLSSGLFAAQIQPTVGVSGTVSGVCKAGTAGNLAFTIDPSAAGPISAAVTDATVFCSNGTPFTVTAESFNKGGGAASCASSGTGIAGTLKDGANTMDYTFKCGVGGTNTNAGTGQGLGAGKDIALGITGSITASSYADAPVSSSYADTITLTVTY